MPRQLPNTLQCWFTLCCLKQFVVPNLQTNWHTISRQHKMALVYKKVKIWQIWGMDLAGVLRRQICNLLTCGTCSSWSILAPNFGWFYQLSLFQLSKRYPENPKYITQEVWGLCLPDIVLRAFGTQAAWYVSLWMSPDYYFSTTPADFHPIQSTWRSVSAIAIRFLKLP